MKKIEIKKILVPIDFTETSFVAMEEAVSIAKLSKATLCLIHVIEFNGYYFSMVPETQAVLPALLEIEKGVQRKLNALSEEIKIKSAVDVEVYVTTGQIYSEIIDFSEKNNIDLILMGTHGASGYRELFIGSNAQRVVNHSKIPVLTIQEKRFKKEIKNILVPIDSSLHSREKMNFTIVLANLLKAKIHLIGIDDTKSKDLKSINIKLKSVEDLIISNNLTYQTTIISENNIALASMNYAKENGCDLIVINIGHESNMSGVLSDFFSQQIVNHSKIPVLSLKHSEGYFSINTPGFGI